MRPPSSALSRPSTWLALVAGLFCCGETVEPVELDDFARQARLAVCDWAVRCGHVPDRPSCERTLDPKDYDTRRAVDSIAAGLSRYDAEEAGRCIDTTRRGFCLSAAFSDPSCFRVFVGVRGQGEACTSRRECAGGAACESLDCAGQCCTGICGAPTEPAPVGGEGCIGESCEGHGDCAVGGYCETDRRCAGFGDEEGDRCLIGCARGDLYCDIETFTCRRFGAPGERCDEAGAGAVPCDPAWAVCDGVCRPRPGIGERCNGTSRLCIPTTLCDVASGVCVARRGLGEPCTDRGQCELECDIGLGECVPYQACE